MGLPRRRTAAQASSWVGHAGARHEAACRAAGYETLLTKPMTFERLLGVVNGSAN